MPTPLELRSHPGASRAPLIFLSSTVGDFRDFRREVQDVLVKKAKCSCFLSEDWIDGYVSTVQRCRERVCQSDGFIMLLGYWYGSIPPDEYKSITHLEFEWAMERWKGDRFPKMAALRPKLGKKADKMLKELAQRLLPETQGERDLHAERLANFHAQVDDRRTEWRTILTFEDVHDLREHVLVIGREWRGITPQAAAHGVTDAWTVQVEPQVSDEQLGRLGREAQTRSIRRLLSGLAVHPDVPALALVIHGDEDDGQRAFVAYVLGSLLKGYHPKRRIGRLPPGSCTVQALVAWISATLGLPRDSGVDTPEALAEQVVEELKHQHLCFVVDRLGTDYPGGIAAFQQSFWKPFWTRMKAVRDRQQIGSRLVGVVIDYSGEYCNWSGAVVDAECKKVTDDFSKLIAVPPLGHFDQHDLYGWFEDLEVPDSPPGRREQLALRALRDLQSGNFDGMPLHVFERLKGERLWPEGDHR